ncbi:MAG: MBL fold metallo-hydrolase [Nanoarchaeota archaeon]|nr:MBL fold metallo-hydrolase [Nanoarchaeota archaeon]
MEMIVLGSGTSAPQLNKNMSGYLLDFNGNKILFDSGPGTIRQLLKIGVNLQEIDHIFYTHFHNDHISDLPAIIWSNNYGLLRKKTLNFYGPKGFKEYYKILIKNMLRPKKLNYKINIKEMRNNSIIKINIKNNSIIKNNLIIKSLISKHTNTSVSYRIENNNKSIVYSGDTDYSNEIIKISKNADLLILECSFPDNKKVEGHLTPSLCGKIATKAKVKKLVLTHLTPDCDKVDIKKQCKKEFNGDVVLAKDFMKMKP